MPIVNGLKQGTQEWEVYRLEHYNASEASVMLGLDPHMNRDELLKLKKFGIEKEISDYVRDVIFNNGHEVEARARPIAEEIIGEDLYPEVHEDGLYSCSCDGLTMTGEIAWEHKQWNADLAAMVEDGIVPDRHQPQCQQILFVTGAEKLLFMVSDGTKENCTFAWVEPDRIWEKKIKAGWRLFGNDLESYQYREVEEPKKAAPEKSLPAVTVQAKGELVLCNLDDVRPHFDRFLAEAVIEMETDEDFAAAEQQAKLGRETAKRCKLTAKSVVDQMASVSDVVRELEDYAGKFNALALQQEKAVKQQKEMRKAQAITEREQLFRDHVAALESEIQPIRLQVQGPDFRSAAKNQRLLSSLYAKLDTELANAKIEADETAKDIRGKLAWLRTEAEDYKFLFRDIQSIISESMPGLQAIVKQRIDEHKAEEQRKLEAERERIRAEEERKAREEAERKLQAERKKAEDEERKIREEAERKAREEQKKIEEAERLEAYEKAERIRESNQTPVKQNPEPAEAPAVDGDSSGVEQATRQYPKNYSELYWRPMDSAPMDGRKVVILNVFNVSIEARYAGSKYGWKHAAMPVTEDVKAWMPLPEEPEEI